MALISQTKALRQSLQITNFPFSNVCCYSVTIHPFTMQCSSPDDKPYTETEQSELPFYFSLHYV